ncbi:dpoa decarboxylase [Enterobacter ludwigii]|nr:dpoa decarboxylase [Enterobacter ludwigii]
MNKATNLFIRNIYSRYQDRILATAVYNHISQEAMKRCGLHDEIYESLLVAGLREYIGYLNKKDAETLMLYAESQGIRTDDERYFQTQEAERQCREAISRNQM